MMSEPTSNDEMGRLIIKALELDALASRDWVAHTYKNFEDARRYCRSALIVDHNIGCTTPEEMFAHTFPRGCGALWHRCPNGGFSGLPGMVEASADDVRFMEFARTFVPAAARWIAAHLPEIEQRDKRAFGADLNSAENRLSLFGYDNSTKAGLLLEAYRTAEIRRLEYKAFLMRTGQLNEREKESDRLWEKRNRKTLGGAEDAAALASEARQALDALPVDTPSRPA